jgi:hypothetical protein
MKPEKKKSDKNNAKQHPEDAEKHNAQQEREYREQKDGTMKKSPETDTDDNATEKFTDIKSEKNKKDEEK